VKNYKIALNLFFFFLVSFCYSQQDTVVDKKDIKDVYREIFPKMDTARKLDNKVIFSLLPAPSGDSEAGLVISFVTTFYTDENHHDTKMSEIYFSPYFSFTGQYVFPVQTYIYTKNNKYNFIGDYRYMIYPQPTYGLGPYTTKDQMSTLSYSQWRFYQFVTVKVKGDFRLGGGILYDNYQNITEESDITEETDFSKYMKGDFADETSIGIAAQLLYDSRKNIINPEQGVYFETDFRINTSGVEDKNWKSVYVDLRKYISFSNYRHKVLAGRAFYWATFDGKPHYLDLPSIGWDRQGKTGRGFTKNRLRSNSLLYFETEYRTDLSRNGFFGAVFFSNVSSVSELGSYGYTKWNPAIGTGLRVKWNKRNNNNVILDVGVSKNDWSLRFGLAENF
jgi:hypothetical protein